MFDLSIIFIIGYLGFSLSLFLWGMFNKDDELQELNKTSGLAITIIGSVFIGLLWPVFLLCVGVCTLYERWRFRNL